MADATIRFDTRIDPRGFNDGVGEMQRGVNNFRDSLSQASERINTTFDVRTQTNSFTQSLNGLNTFVSGTFMTNWRNAWQGVQNVFSNIWGSLWGIAKTPINLIIDGINAMTKGVASALSGTINVVVSAINTLIRGALAPLNLLISAMNVIPGVNVPSLSVTLPSAPSFSQSIPAIPRLAQGAVIPPNAPFLAVLGDQTSGTNIEAPLATIEQAVKNALSNINNINNTAGNISDRDNINIDVRFTGDGAALAEMLAPMIVVSINGIAQRTGMTPLIV